MDHSQRTSRGALGVAIFALCYLIWAAVFCYVAVTFLLDQPLWMLVGSTGLCLGLPAAIAAASMYPARRRAFPKGRLNRPFVH